MSYHTDRFPGQSNAQQPQTAQGNGAFQHPGPLSSNPPFGVPSFQPLSDRPQNTAGCHSPESASYANSNSWMPSAHQALNNALQASGFGDMQNGMETMSPLPSNGNPVPSIIEPPVAPPNSPIQDAPGVMGGQAQGASNNMANGVVNGAANGHVPSAANTQYFIANGTSQPVANRFPQGTVIVTNGDSQALGSSGIANRLPHGAQLYPSRPVQNMNALSVEPSGLISPPHGHHSQPGSHHSTRSDSVGVAQHFYTPVPPAQNPNMAGLPQSVSFHAGVSMMSPTNTPHHFSGERMSDSLSTPGTTHHLTEPRNYAPRTAGQPVDSLPPPRFNLDLQTISSACPTSPRDPFGSPERAEPSALIPFPNMPPPAMQQAMLTAAMAVPFTGNKSQKLHELTGTYSGLPTLETAMSPAFFPFMSGPGSAKPSTAGVVRLKNIPFSTKRSEIVAFIGRNSRMLSDGEEPIHIIMDRATSKTMDAFVEFMTMEDAMRCAEKHHQYTQTGRISRLGERPVEVELSSQAALMQELFPLARGVFWDGANPQFLPINNTEPWENFKGFIFPEEMVMLVKHVEVPHRSPFSKECPQRPYECLISTLRKFPWYASDHITIAQRGAMYKATIKLLRLLTRSVSGQDDPVNLTNQLFQRVIRTAMECKGFTILQKDNIAFMAQMAPAEQQRRHGQPMNPTSWVHQYAIARKPGIPLDIVDWYIRLIREQTTRDVLIRPIHERTSIQETLKDTDEYWGYFYHEVNYAQGPQFDGMTLGKCAFLELSAIERILGRALGYN
ncbi:unnamed protein product [Fusarium graminearum]|uniref:Uncharacterized protein n=1 Tax=Gibberella zeae TaxID=5518 RepID=A0A2H3H1V5_GIBZA|nr:hypothetical protein FG05_08918 [Fusarium graminearum]KAI6763616.1 hypothetical protein HG531_013004 [Fusarium graminearum]PCD33928.1 hypothetical protein FGRA07_09083 [Fusarium graminearum]CAF3432873.1 unnamed protein product [Fusarium graminearum]CAF3665368.1 unnamed protein product [Fusarium graminearum]